MATINVNSLDQLKQFLNKNDVLEIVVRDKKSKYKEFVNVALSKLGNENQQESVSKVLNIVKKNQKLNEKNFQILNNVQNLAGASLILNGVNLCATCAGFAIMDMKLKKMSSQIDEILKTIKAGQEISANYEINKIISVHSDMLDCRKKQKYFTEKEMRELVDGEYNVLNMLLEVLLKNAVEDEKSLIFSILTLSSMLSVSLEYFDDVYYFNNKDSITTDEIWHNSHDTWMKLYETLQSKAFVDKIQDYVMLDLGLNTIESDYYLFDVVDEIKYAEQRVLDNQYLLKTLDNQEMIEDFKEYNNEQIKDEIENAIKEADIKSDANIKTFNESMKCVGVR